MFLRGVRSMRHTPDSSTVDERSLPLPRCSRGTIGRWQPLATGHFLSDLVAMRSASLRRLRILWSIKRRHRVAANGANALFIFERQKVCSGTKVRLAYRKAIP